MFTYALIPWLEKYRSGMEEMSLGEAKSFPDLFTMEYIQTLNLWGDIKLVQNEKETYLSESHTCLKSYIGGIQGEI